MNVMLSFSLSGTALLASLLTGVSFDDNVTNNPMFCSSSPSDFWGRRWNNLIHTDLKRGVYRPILRSNSGSKALASLATFCMSGILHEYVWALLFVPNHWQREEEKECCPSCYCHWWFGKQFVFFGWNGILIVLENVIMTVLKSKGDYYSSWMCCWSYLPLWLRHHLVVVLSLPVGHLFTADMIGSGGARHLEQGIPLIQIKRS